MKKNSNSGRPSNQERNRIAKNGIIPKPIDNNIVEMVYDNPSIFGIIFSAGHRISDQTINLIFLKNGAYVLASPINEDNNKMLVSFNCSNLVSYYCKEDKYYICDCAKILKVINAKLSEDCLITFSINENTVTTLNISSQDLKKKYKKKMSFPIEVCEKINLDFYEDIIKQTLDYPLKFTLGWKNYKKLISSWKKLQPETVLIEKDENLCFKFEEDIKNEHILYDVEMTFSGDDVFAIKVNFKKLTQIALAEGLSNELTFIASEDNYLISRAFIDEVIQEKKKISGTELGTVYFFTKIE